nr:uncharacterized protein LOC128691773 [Cherax quadricarinatus]
MSGREQLQEWQSLQSKPMDHTCSIGIQFLDNLENIIFISHGSDVTFYSDDMSAHYYPTFTLKTTCTTISDLHGMKMVEDYIVLYTCHNAPSGRVTVEAMQIIFHNVDLAESDETADTLLQCLDDLSDALESRKGNITYIDDVISSNSLMTFDNPQTWMGPVVFAKGLTVTGTTHFTQTLDVKASEDEIRLSQFASLVGSLQNDVNALIEESEGILYFTGDQNLTGPIIASTITANEASFNVLKIQNINGIPLLDLEKRFLISGIDQIIETSVIASSLTVDLFTTRSPSLVGTINGFLTTDLMRKSLGDQVVTGEHTYNTVVCGGITNMDGNIDWLSINGIHSSAIVTEGSDVTFTDKKKFNSLTVTGQINARLINDVDVSDLASKVIYMDVMHTQTLTGSYSLAYVKVDGNVDVATINNINFRELAASVVKTTGDYALEGPIKYMESVTVTGDLDTASINGVEWRDIVDLESGDLISGKFYIAKGFVSEVIRCDSINELDLSNDVVLTHTMQTIYGRITFDSDVYVTGAAGVVMDNDATINNIDPSSLKIDVSTLGVLVVEDAVNFSVPLTCTGDVTASTINGLSLHGIENLYWRRSVDQDINVNVHINQAVFLEAVTGSSINGNQMTDYLDFRSLQMISGSYTFQDSVTVKGNLELGPGSTVNGIDVVTLNNTVLTLYGDQTIEGPMNCHSRLTIGTLDLSGTLNGINLSTDLMRLDEDFEHKGHLVFVSNTVAESIFLNSHLNVDSLNGFDVRETAENMVIMNEDAIISGSSGLQLTGTVSITTLNVSGTIDGVNLEDLVKRALLKSSASPQVVTGHVTVTEGVHFSQPPTLDKVNSKNWEKHLNDVVLKNYSGIISGTKTFHQPLNILGNFDPVTINGIRVADLASRCLTKSSDQVIYNPYTFNSSISVSYLSSPVIDGVNMSNILLIDQAGNLGGTAVFMSDTTFIGDVTSAHNLLGCDELNKRPIIRDQYGNINIHESIRIEDLSLSGTVISEAAVMAGTTQKINLDHFLDSLVLKSVPQEIYGTVEFLGDVNVSSMTVNTINDVNIVELYRDSVMDDEDTVITCNLEFSNPLTVNNLVVETSILGKSGSGVLVNGVNIAYLQTQAVLDNEDTFIIVGDKTFHNGFSTDNLMVNKTLGGVAVNDLVAFPNARNLSEVVFNAPIMIRGNLNVSGLLDGINLADVMRNRVTLDGSHTLLGACKFDAINVEGNIEVEKINDVVIANLVRKVAPTQIISGHKTFGGGLTVNGEINATVLNGIYIKQLKNIVRTDKDYNITHPVTFEASVRTSSLVEVNGTVSQDLHSLDQNISILNSELENRYEYIKDLQNEIETITRENYAGARAMFLVLAYLEKVNYYKLRYFGGMKFITDYNLEGGNTLLSVKSCDRDCVCDAETRLYKVSQTGTVAEEASIIFPGSVFIFGWPAMNLQITLTLICHPEASVAIEVSSNSDGYLHTVLKAQMSLGLVIDSAMFIDGSAAYVVTIAMFEDATNSTSETSITTLKYNSYTSSLSKVWEERTHRSAAKLDLTKINGNWFLLVANQLGTENIDVYTAISKVYIWDSTGEEFISKGEYVADHVTSGMFMKSVRPEEENFFSLTQLKAAKYPVFEENLEYTKKVLVFRYSNETGSFAEFESLDTFGVVDQATLTVGESLYLLLLSQVEERLDVYEYFPLEGFKLYQKVRVARPYALEVVELQMETFVLVSTSLSQGLLKLKVNTKGVDGSKF